MKRDIHDDIAASEVGCCLLVVAVYFCLVVFLAHVFSNFVR